MRIISLVGFQGSGKDTAGQYLVEKRGFVNFSFAESLKDTVAAVFCWPRDMIEGATPESRKWREQVDPWWAEKLGIPNFTPRYALQFIGTDVFRKHFDENIWILNIERKLTLLPNDSDVVIIDGRFPNELNLGRKYGAKVVRVKRGDEPWFYEKALRVNTEVDADVKSQKQIELNDRIHISEWAWVGERLDHVVSNDHSFDDLYKEMDEVVNNA